MHRPASPPATPASSAPAHSPREWGAPPGGHAGQKAVAIPAAPGVYHVQFRCAGCPTPALLLRIEVSEGGAKVRVEDACKKCKSRYTVTHRRRGDGTTDLTCDRGTFVPVTPIPPVPPAAAPQANGHVTPPNGRTFYG